MKNKSLIRKIIRIDPEAKDKEIRSQINPDYGASALSGCVRRLVMIIVIMAVMTAHYSESFSSWFRDNTGGIVSYCPVPSSGTGGLQYRGTSVPFLHSHKKSLKYYLLLL